MDIISCQRYISDVASVAHIFLCILLNIGVCYVLDTLLGRVEAYFMRCNCHDKDFCERNGLEQQRKDCPEKGCVAPDLAVMDIDTFGNELADASFTDLEEYLERTAWNGGRLEETLFLLRFDCDSTLMDACLQNSRASVTGTRPQCGFTWLCGRCIKI
jgi:hypothetical protein